MDELKRDCAVGQVSSEAEGLWFTFRLDDQLYGIPVSYVEQIQSMMPITEIPEYPYYSKGIINIRGAIVPVLDLRLRLGKEEKEYHAFNCIIICRIHGDLIGFVADGVDAVLSIASDCITDPPQIGETYAVPYLSGIARIPGEEDGSEKLILCLDAVRALLEQDEEKS